MKRLLLACAALGVLLLISFQSYYGLYHDFEEFQQELEPFLSEEDVGSLEDQADVLRQKWEKSTNSYGCFMQQNELRELTLLFVQLTAYCREDDEKEVRNVVTEIRYSLDELLESEYPTITNIF